MNQTIKKGRNGQMLQEIDEILEGMRKKCSLAQMKCMSEKQQDKLINDLIDMNGRIDEIIALLWQ